ncbi:hypothetical protein GCWU000182_00349 [Abiotrophia defectiva ATCC 49176]|uniref:Uncharacterized protein n=1 Tax=Abiotrophia defectiva ATCC 49176 TaxID=592010 RepID=W1Q4Z5_ABIDE|nr:hypothetical protein GCWU000182_00349 [Abiotrophia defectiva ATCC 49176]
MLPSVNKLHLSSTSLEAGLWLVKQGAQDIALSQLARLELA